MSYRHQIIMQITFGSRFIPPVHHPGYPPTSNHADPQPSPFLHTSLLPNGLPTTPTPFIETSNPAASPFLPASPCHTTPIIYLPHPLHTDIKSRGLTLPPGLTMLHHTDPLPPPPPYIQTANFPASPSPPSLCSTPPSFYHLPLPTYRHPIRRPSSF